MRKILIAIDGSEPAARAVDHALDLAEGRQGLEVLLVNVEPKPVAWQTHGLAKEAIDAHLAELGKATLAPAAERLGRARVPFKTRVALGDPAGTITALADAEGCDLIVMGTRGLGAVSGLLLGSVATKVVHLAHVPVTLVK